MRAAQLNFCDEIIISMECIVKRACLRVLNRARAFEIYFFDAYSSLVGIKAYSLTLSCHFRKRESLGNKIKGK